MKTIPLLIIIFASFVYGQRADFYKEDITFRLDSASFDVEGYYWFANNSGKSVNSDIYYPFPYHSGESIDSIRLYNITAGQMPRYSHEDKYGITFPLSLAPHDTALFQIGYRQKLKGDSAVYILTTTKAWGKPLAWAEYKLVVPDYLIIKKFSYPPDKQYKIEGYIIYYWKKEIFMPDKDMIFYF